NEIAIPIAAALDALRSGRFHFVPLCPYRRRRAGCSPPLAPNRRKSAVRRRKLSSAKRERRHAPAHLEATQRQFLLGKNGSGRIESGAPWGNYLPLRPIGGEKKKAGSRPAPSRGIAPTTTHTTN